MSTATSSWTWRGGAAALLLNGSGQYLAYAQPLLPPGDFTIAVTFCAGEQGPGYTELVSQSGNVCFYLGRTPHNRTRAGDGWSDTGVPFPSNGAWHRLTLVRGAAGTALYLDGVEVQSLPSPLPLPIPNQPDERISRVGCQYGDIGEFFSGAIAEIVVWRGAHSAEQVRSYVGGTLSGGEPDLQALLRFDLYDQRELVSGAAPSQRRAECGPAPSGLPRDPEVVSFTQCPFAKGWFPENMGTTYVPTAGISRPPKDGPILIGGWGVPQSTTGIGYTLGAVEMTALRRETGQLDFAIKARVNATAVYTSSDKYRRHFQDQVTVCIQPVPETSPQVLLSRCSGPQHNPSSARYDERIAWSAPAGFSRQEGGDIWFRATSPASSVYDSFRCMTSWNDTVGSVEFQTELQAIYYANGNRFGRIYESPVSLLDFWAGLLHPSSLARTSLDQEYLALYTSRPVEVDPMNPGAILTRRQVLSFLIEIRHQLRTVYRDSIYFHQTRTSIYSSRFLCIADLDSGTFQIQDLGMTVLMQDA